ncbi:MAG: Ig-like domain-containing protein, partial [Deltaproteobacteria bacterium]|nr:Ig-like domain-containing protein [Deltaproteobacteria bacterium]
MLRRTIFLLVALLFVLGAGPLEPARAVLQAVGPAADPLNPGFPGVMPHGFPGYYQDANGLKLELCLDPVDPVTLAGPCVFDPIDQANPVSVASGFGAEAFYLLAQADARPLVEGGKAFLVVALEAAYAVEEPAAGDQMTFGRVRVRFDTTVAQDYRIIHPYGSFDITAAEAAESIALSGQVRVTQDLGWFDPVNPAAGFNGALLGWNRADTGPTSFLTWSTYPTDPALQVPILDPVTGLPTGAFKQYIGDAVTPHTVTGGTNGNIFAIQAKDAAGNFTTISQTDLWIVSGKVAPATATYTPYTYPAKTQNLAAVGPVNRKVPFPQPGSNLPSDGTNPLVPAGPDYPVGYPFWYQEAPSPLDPVGLKLTICPGGDPMCISAPPDPLAGLNVGDESFYWSADARLNYRSPDGQVRLDANLVLAMEATFSNPAGAVIDGDQIVFGRTRLRVRSTHAGTYVFTHPYGTLTVPISEADVNTRVSITEDIGTMPVGLMPPVPATSPLAFLNPNPDAAFTGALYSRFSQFLRWPDLNDPRLKVLDPLTGTVQFAYVGNPLFQSQVVGSPTGNNFFSVDAPGIIPAGAPGAQTDLFTVTGKLFDPTAATVPPVVSLAPVANPDPTTTSTAAAVTINVLANDFNIPAAGASVNLTTLAPVSGTTVVNADNTITYTPAATAAPGLDSFSYTVTVPGTPALTSNPAQVSITLTPAVPPEVIAVTRAELDVAKREWKVQGTANAGSTLTIYAGGAPGGTVIGSTVV